VRYRVLDLPPKGTGAFTPIPTTNPVASSYGLVRVTAALGLKPVATGAPRVMNLGWSPQTMPSNNAPDVILPDQYVPSAKNMGPSADAGIGMAARRMNPLPVPAISGILLPTPAFSRKRTGGRATMSWPRAFQKYPTLSSGKGNTA
jgi:hypothetical protein